MEQQRRQPGFIQQMKGETADDQLVAATLEHPGRDLFEPVPFRLMSGPFQVGGASIRIDPVDPAGSAFAQCERHLTASAGEIED